MTLDKAEIGKSYIITDINSDNELSHRLYSMGIYQGTVFHIGHISAMKNTYSIHIEGGSQVALRKNEAEVISIKEYKE